MSGFTITVTGLTQGQAARMLERQPVEIVPHAKAARLAPLWAGKTVEIVGIEVNGAFRAWITDADGMPEQRVWIHPDDIATILLKSEGE